MIRLIVILSLLASPAVSVERPPNIVLIFTDDLGYGDVGCYGATKVKTPNIDRLAAEGRRFTDAHSASAVCTPSRYALLTGEYPFRRDLWGPVMNASALVVDPAQATMASVLRQQGYATVCFGKWHLGFGSKPSPDWNADLKPGPLELGFDHFFGIPVVNSHPPFVWVEDHRVVGLDPADPLVYGGEPPTQSFPEKMMRPPMSGAKAAHALYRDEEVGATLTERALAWLRAHRDEPFFLYFATPHIHHPFTPAKRFQGTSGCGRYGDFIHELDWMVGEVTRTLDELKLRENTLVILTSDNGGMLNVGGQEAWRAGHRMNGDLLGFKFDAWEGGHRVPFIARWPGRIPAGSVSEQLISNVDLLATFAALAGAEVEPGQARDSVNILPALTGQPDKPLRTELVISPNSPKHLALREGRWMYIGAKGNGGWSAPNPGDHLLGGAGALKFTGQVNSDVAEGRFKPDVPEAQLYDLVADLHQSRNVILDHPEVAARMRARLAALRPAAGETRTAPEEIYSHPKPVGALHFDFESGDLQGWRVVEGGFEALINDRRNFHHTYGSAAYNKQGRYFLTTLERKEGGKGKDAQTGVVESPVFRITGGRASFLVGGGRHPDTYVALVDAETGKEQLKAQGGNTEIMLRVNWDVSAYRGQKMFLRIVDRHTGAWGHVTFDDFSAEAEP